MLNAKKPPPPKAIKLIQDPIFLLSNSTAVRQQNFVATWKKEKEKEKEKP